MEKQIEPKNTEKNLTHTEKKIIRGEEKSLNWLRREALDALSDFRRHVNNFDFISDSKLVDVCIYDIEKSQTRYEYLINELKQISHDPYI